MDPAGNYDNLIYMNLIAQKYIKCDKALEIS